MASKPQWDPDPVKQPALPAQGLKFVGVKDGAEINRSHRAMIRSQVMLDFYQKQSQQGVYSKPYISENHVVAADAPAQYMNRFRVVTPDQRSRRTGVSKKGTTKLKKRSIQPRLSFPAASQPRLKSVTPVPQDLLSQHLVAMIAVPEVHEREKSSKLMLNLRKGYFQLAMQDSAFLSACISHYAGIFSLITGGGDPTESLQLRMRSTALINSRLNEPAIGVSDGTVGAVASIINYETNNGTSLAVQTHLTGLKAMLRIRGGFLNAGFSPLLQRMIAWAELTSAYFLSTQPTIIPFNNPKLDLPSRISHIYPYLKSQSPTAIALPTPSTYDIDWQTIDKDPASIFADLRFLSYALVSQETEVCSIDPLWYSDKIYLVQRSLIYLVMNPEPQCTYLDTACYITASLYVDCRLRDLGLRSVAISITVSRLRAALPQVFEDLPQHFGCSLSIKRILWILVFAGIAASWRPERPWFIKKLAAICQILKLESWIDLTAVLESVLWDEQWEMPHEVLWREVEEHLNYTAH